MTLVSFLSNIRNAAIMNAVIVIFHIWVALAIEGVGFLAIVLPIGALIAGSYYFKGKIGALLLLLPTLAYLVVVPDMINGLSEASSPDNEIGFGVFILIPFWWLTIISNIFTILAELRRKKEEI
ncbi:MAG: hypothetical protein VYD40_04235 [Chloroflexota bacterium]|jgi:hypothetical protein|nr:hypothetical protein [Chloroflexota bacterium]MEE2620982.1 hypothetical protein [Chloroflexota bacterium]|tara:strand:- start:892 stop:1263 length:372 start_codon:yes stop_codon:yes gene_type:complete